MRSGAERRMPVCRMSLRAGNRRGSGRRYACAFQPRESSKGTALLNCRSQEGNPAEGPLPWLMRADVQAVVTKTTNASKKGIDFIVVDCFGVKQ